MAAVSLRRAGHDVTVYERSRAGLVGRGGGVTTSRAVLDGLKGQGLIDRDFPSAPYTEILLSKAVGPDDRYGRCPLRLPLAMHCLHWSGLWENIRKRVPDDAYHNGMALDRAEDTGDSVMLSFEDGTRARADLVCFADGYASQGRRAMFPQTALVYRDYLVWRGVVSEADIGTDPILEQHPRISLRDGRGSFISYVIHDRDGSLHPGRRLVNWAVYLDLPEAELDDFMIDAAGRARTGTIPAGHMRPEQDAALKDRMRRALPTYFADMAAASRDNQIQLIYTARPPAYRKGRMCLLGDAGAMVPPLTGAGLFKGYENATGLGRALSGDGPSDLDAALDGWSDRQMVLADAMLEMGHQMERAFLYDTIDLATAGEAEARAWFDDALRIAPEFSYFDPSLARPAQAAQ
nr:hypothetical protein [Jannaschia sp. LMIT008]